MHLASLRLRNFRNYKDERIFFHPKMNLIVGENGAGKTNLLEAIYFLSTGRSFRTPLLKDLIHQDADYFFLEASFIKDGVSQTLLVGYDEKTKKIEHNATKLSSLSNILGIMPSVLFSPKDVQIITGSPADRRRFLNLHLAQSDPLYVYHLLRYTRALKQRNAFFKQKSLHGIECFEEQMATSSLYLMQARDASIRNLQTLIASKAEKLSFQNDSFEIKYLPSFNCRWDPLVFQQEFNRLRNKEHLLKSTLIGPHRDDVLINHQNKAAKSYASEGQKRTFLSALKFSEWELLKENQSAPPIISIDDIGMHLDLQRKSLLKETLKQFEQGFLTLPTDKDAREFADHKIEIKKGQAMGATSPLNA